MGQEPLEHRLARKLRTLRGELPQRRFAEKIGISKSTLNRLEMGDQNISLKTLKVLCQRLKCDIGDLFPKD
jgi:DNA-binding Xre family transcriptional regulator